MSTKCKHGWSTPVINLPRCEANTYSKIISKCNKCHAWREILSSAVKETTKYYKYPDYQIGHKPYYKSTRENKKGENK